MKLSAKYPLISIEKGGASVCAGIGDIVGAKLTGDCCFSSERTELNENLKFTHSFENQKINVIF